MSMREAAQRSEVYWAIDGERDYQDWKWPDTGGAGGHRHTVGEELLLLNQYVAEANGAWTVNVGDEAALHMVRKIAAIAVRCMENHGALSRG